MTEKDKIDIKNKIATSEFAVYHETSQDGKHEIVFTLVANTMFSSEAEKGLIENYSKTFPISEISKNSQQYLASTTPNFTPILLSKIEKNSLFEAPEIQFIENNINNFLSKKLLGEPINASLEFEEKFDKYTQRVGSVVVGTIELASDVVQQTIAKVAQAKPQEIFEQGRAHLSSSIAFFRNKLKTKIEQNNSPKK